MHSQLDYYETRASSDRAACEEYARRERERTNRELPWGRIECSACTHSAANSAAKCGSRCDCQCHQ